MDLGFKVETLLNNAFNGTMSHLQARKNEKVKFQRHLKDDTNLELPLKKKGGGGVEN